MRDKNPKIKLNDIDFHLYLWSETVMRKSQKKNLEGGYRSRYGSDSIWIYFCFEY